MNLSLLRKVVQRLINEEIGRNYHTLDNDPYSYEDYPGIHPEVYPMSDGSQWFAQVTVDFDDTLSTPLRAFGSEEDAKNFIRQHAEKANRVRLSKNIDTGTPSLSQIK